MLDHPVQRLFAAALLGLALAGCSTKTGDTAGAPAPSPAPPPTSGIGPAGGSVSGPYGAQVSVPAGALATTVDVQIARDATGSPALPTAGIDTAGAIYALTPHGTAFNAAATVRIPFDADRIPTDAAPTLYKAEPGGAFAPIATGIDNGMLVADVANFSWIIPGYASTRPRVVYALTNGANGFAVSGFKITKGSGALAAVQSSAPTGDMPVSVAVHPSRRFAYVTNAGTSTANGVAANSIAAYKLDVVTGEITGPIDSKPAGARPISVVVHPTGKFVYVVNEVRFGATAGNVTVFTIDETTGALSAGTTTADLGGVPATALAFTPSGRHAYVTYLDAGVRTYAVNATSGVLTGPNGNAATGSNPWAIAVTPDARFAYVASLGTQGSVNELSTYAIDQQTGVLGFQGSVGIQRQPAALAMDPFGRFLYVGKQQPDLNENLLTFRIDGASGALTPTSGVLLGGGPEVGPIAVVAEPQGEFVYAIDFNNGTLVAFKLDAGTGQLAPAGSPQSGVFAGGATGGIGDPFLFAASGTSPVWYDGCTILVDGNWVFSGCTIPLLGSSTSGGGGSGGGSSPPPSAKRQLDVTIGVEGGTITSTPPGIDYSLSPSPGGHNKPLAAFDTGTLVTLCETPPSGTGLAYDVKWTGTGGCGGQSTCTTVAMTSDQSCRLELIPR